MYFKKQFMKNISLVSLSIVFNKIFSFLTIIIISRYLGASGLGQYSFIFSFVSFFFIFGDLGLNQLMVKELSKDFSKTNKYISNILSSKILFNLIIFFFYFASLFFIGKDDIFYSLVLVGIILFLKNLSDTPLEILRVRKEGKKIGLLIVIESIISFLAALIILPITESMFLLVLGFLISRLVIMILSFYYARKYFKFKFELDKKFLLGLLKKSYPFMFIALFSLIAFRMDTVILSFLKTDVVVGWYNSGYKLIKTLDMIPGIILFFAFPIFSELYGKNKEKLKTFFEKIIQFVLILIMPIVVIVNYFGYEILNLFYDFNSYDAAITFSILIIAEGFIYLTMVLGDLISSSNNQLFFMKITGLAALINIVLNLIFIPRYSLYGAAFTTLFTYFFMFVVMFIYVRKKIFQFDFLKYLIIPSISSFFMWLVLISIVELNFIFVVTICAIVYALIVITSLSYFH